jgi:hypothetical protein
VPLPGTQRSPIMSFSGDASGVPMRQEELEGRAGQGPDGKAKRRMANLGCVCTQHQVDDEGHPIRDANSTTCVSTIRPLEEFGPLLRQEAIRRGLPLAVFVVLLIAGAARLAEEICRARVRCGRIAPLSERGRPVRFGRDGLQSGLPISLARFFHRGWPMAFSPHPGPLPWGEEQGEGEESAPPTPCRGSRKDRTLRGLRQSGGSPNHTTRATGEPPEPTAWRASPGSPLKQFSLTRLLLLEVLLQSGLEGWPLLRRPAG